MCNQSQNRVSKEAKGDLAVEVEARVGEAQRRAVELGEAFAAQTIDLRGEAGADREVQIVFEGGEVEAAGEAEAGEEALAEVLLGAQVFGLRLAQAGLFDTLQVTFRGAIVHPPTRHGRTV